MQKSESIAALAGALSKAQGEIVDAVKDKAAHKYKYADLGQVLNIIRPIFSRHGLAMTQIPMNCSAENGIIYLGLETVVMHESGEWYSGECVMPVEPSKGMSLAQSYGSILTYLRRYSAAAVAGITQEDNDAAIHREQKTKQQEYSDQASDMVTEFNRKMADCSEFEALKDVYKDAYMWAKDNSDSVSGKQIQKTYNDLKTLSGWA